jgi:AAA15 family ATPase/GTPase
MTNVLTVKNFRSIKDAEIELGIFTVLNGENNSGKSSFLYALQVMKNIVSNPNQTVDELLNLHFLNLGGINETVFQKQNDKEIRLSLHNSLHYYEIMVSSKRGKLSIEGYTPFEGKGALDITFPYALNKKIDISRSFRFISKQS